MVTPESGWQPIETAPKDGTTVEVRGVMRVHYMEGCRFAMMPKDWRPDTPQTAWRMTEWRPVAPASEQAAAVAAEEQGLARSSATRNTP